MKLKQINSHPKHSKTKQKTPNNQKRQEKNKNKKETNKCQQQKSILDREKTQNEGSIGSCSHFQILS